MARTYSPRQVISESRRFWNKVSVRGPDDCWLWTGGDNGVYGVFRAANGMIGAHKFAYQDKLGAVRDLFVLHTCDIPKCCNPKHLFLGTHSDNMRDMERKNRHPRQQTKFTMISDATRQQIKNLATIGYSQRRLAAQFKLCKTTIARILNG